MDIKTAFVEVFFQPDMSTELTLEELFQEFSQWAMQEQMKGVVDQVTEDQTKAIKAEATEIVNSMHATLEPCCVFGYSEPQKFTDTLTDKGYFSLLQQVRRLSEILNITLENTDEPGTTTQY